MLNKTSTVTGCISFFFCGHFDSIHSGVCFCLFTKILFNMNCYVCYQGRSFLSLTKKCYLTSNSLNFFHLILYTKSAYHFLKMRKLSYSKIFKAILIRLAQTLVNVRVTEMLEFSISLLVVFQFMLYSLFFSGVKTLSR